MRTNSSLAQTSSSWLAGVAMMGMAGCALLAGVLDSGAAHASFTISPDGTTINIWGTGRTATNSGVVLNPITNATNLAINQSLLENTWKLISFPNAYVADPHKLNANSGPLCIPSAVPGN